MTHPALDNQLPAPGPADVPAPPPRRPREPWLTGADVRFALSTIAVLVVSGAIAGVVWKWWSHTATRGLVYTKTAIIPDQTEGFVSSDGRFVVITAVIGLVAGLYVWSRRARRGPAAVVGLAVGGAAGAALTDLVGRLLGGGTTHGTVNTVLPRLPLQVHAIGLIFVEAMLATAVYVICAAFVNPDDLGRPAAEPDLVRPGVEVEHAGGDGHGLGLGHQDNLTPQ